MDDESFGMKAAIELLSSLNPTEQKSFSLKLLKANHRRR